MKAAGARGFLLRESRRLGAEGATILGKIEERGRSDSRAVSRRRIGALLARACSWERPKASGVRQTYCWYAEKSAAIASRAELSFVSALLAARDERLATAVASNVEGTVAQSPVRTPFLNRGISAIRRGDDWRCERGG